MEPTTINIGKVNSTQTLPNSSLLKMKLLDMPEELLPSLILRIYSSMQDKWQEMMFKKRSRTYAGSTNYIFESPASATGTLTVQVPNPGTSVDARKERLKAEVEQYYLDNIDNASLPQNFQFLFYENARYVYFTVTFSSKTHVFIPVTSGGNPWVANVGETPVSFRPDYTSTVDDVKAYIKQTSNLDQYEMVIDDAALLNGYRGYTVVDDSEFAFKVKVEQFFKGIVDDEFESVQLVKSCDAKVLGEMPEMVYYGICYHGGDKALIAFVGDGTNVVDVKGNKKSVSRIDDYYLLQLADIILYPDRETTLVKDKTIVLDGFDQLEMLDKYPSQFLYASNHNTGILIDRLVTEYNWGYDDDIELTTLSYGNKNVVVFKNNTRGETVCPVYGSSNWAFFKNNDEETYTMGFVYGFENLYGVQPYTYSGMTYVVPPFNISVPE